MIEEITSGTISRRGVLSFLGPAALSVAVPTVLIGSDAEAQTAAEPTGTERRPTWRTRRLERRQARRTRRLQRRARYWQRRHARREARRTRLQRQARRAREGREAR